ncbi:hypothetical protein NDU88_000123 [Pleurodeles waltl]|uniref:Uncharacterized protein n=1 Tax=Pleurodeles waltl TaxID=8319 RepID=A0AAV7VWG9_PLEWA|nr:hypothetical protein NDU88_000123 [Pleurodeles waltl]
MPSPEGCRRVGGEDTPGDRFLSRNTVGLGAVFGWLSLFTGRSLLELPWSFQRRSVVFYACWGAFRCALVSPHPPSLPCVASIVLWSSPSPSLGKRAWVGRKRGGPPKEFLLSHVGVGHSSVLGRWSSSLCPSLCGALRGPTEPLPGLSVLRGGVSPFLGALVSPPLPGAPGVQRYLRLVSGQVPLRSHSPHSTDEGRGLGGPERGSHRGLQPATGPIRLVGSLPYGTPLTFSGTARRSGRCRAPTTRCSAPSPRGHASPQVIQVIAGRRRTMWPEISGRLHPRSAMLDAASTSRCVSSSWQVGDNIWLFYLAPGGSGVFGVTSKAVMGSDEVFVGGG